MPVQLVDVVRRKGKLPMLDPILMSIAAALTGKAADSLYELVRQKLSKRSSGLAALEAAEGAMADSTEVQVLAAELDWTERFDPEFSAQLRDTWRQLTVHQRAENAQVVNQISGNVEGKVVQARDIEGGVSF